MSPRALHRREKKAQNSLTGRYCWWDQRRSQSYRTRLAKIESLTNGADPAAASASSEPSPPRTISYNGTRYCSLSEAALGVLLEQFLPGFKVIEAKTFQIPIGNGRCVDFLINGVLVEYHALRLSREHGRYGDFACQKEYRRYLKHFRRVRNNPRQRFQLYKATCRRLAARYTKLRRAWIERSPMHSGRELIVATSREEFYEKVIVRFGGPNIPSRGEFLALFWWWVNMLAHQNGLPSLRKSCYKKVA